MLTRGFDNWWVTTGALLSGAWKWPADNSVLLLFVNVGEEPIQTHVSIDGGEYGLSMDRIQVTEIGENGRGAQRTESRVFDRQLTVPARTAVAYELKCVP